MNSGVLGCPWAFSKFLQSHLLKPCLRPEISTEMQSIPMPHLSLSGSKDVVSVSLVSPILPMSYWKFPGPAIPLFQVHRRAKFMPISGPPSRLFCLLRSSPPLPTVYLTNSYSSFFSLLGSPQSKPGPLSHSPWYHQISSFTAHVASYVTCSMFTH